MSKFFWKFVMIGNFCNDVWMDHFDKSISYVMNYVISKYSLSLESCNLALLPYVSFYINKVK